MRTYHPAGTIVHVHFVPQHHKREVVGVLWARLRVHSVPGARHLQSLRYTPIPLEISATSYAGAHPTYITWQAPAYSIASAEQKRLLCGLGSPDEHSYTQTRTHLHKELVPPVVEVLECFGTVDVVHQHAAVRAAIERHPQ